MRLLPFGVTASMHKEGMGCGAKTGNIPSSFLRQIAHAAFFPAFLITKLWVTLKQA